MSVRKELLERELNQLGFRKAGHASASQEAGTVQQQQQQQSQGDHPHAGEGQDNGHSE